MMKIRTSSQQKNAVRIKRERIDRTAEYDSRWRKFSHEYRLRNPFCVECLKVGAYNSQHIHVDHIIPLEQAPERKYDGSNLQSLCRTCHSKKTAKEKLNLDI